MRRICRLSVIALGITLIVGGDAPAQPLVDTAESLESLVVNADRVWVAKIVGVRDEPIPGGSKMPGIAIAVEETLKYPLLEQRHDRMGLFVEHPTARYKAFATHSSRLLITHSDCCQSSPKLIELTPGKVELFLADFTVLHEPDAVVRAAKEIIRRTPPHVRQLHTVRLMIPQKVLVDTNLGPYGQLIVPVDERLEQRAIGFLTSESYSRRSEGVTILRYFKSDANINRLRTLLGDAGFSQQLAVDGNRTKYYGVRDDAYQTLRAWGIEVERPVIAEPDGRDGE
ncbi:hypothetical protein Mal15_56720 [Stieleria maiorica]|uniref:Uncharacterized protein n=1 Tax=Stieleria maiorica TaxID=2795974 RepID=A0A5B9MPD0_9BACT|nr:hypothetical protein [Stieleria maiorica]QEG01595.1 hypothetical protein Mal15_56720 [Stieleria maiorica]